jgi:TRAP-type C4-dicarboxylate transport system permease small subunit
MIIKNAEVELLVADTDVALDEVTVIAADYGGYIISSHTWLEDEYKHATARLGVPAQEFENVLRRLRGLGDAVIWVIVVLGPCLVPVALLVALVILLRRRQQRRKAAPQTPEATEKPL